MTDDLVKRLRNLVGQYIGDADIDNELQDAADRIEHLENRCANLLVENGILNNRIEKLETALREIDEWAEEQCYVGLRKLIRKALEGKDD